MTFSHLHVASHLSAHYGVTSSAAFAGLAGADGATFLALTDRDGLYGGPKHVGACTAAGLSPGLGADLVFVGEEQRDLGRAVVLACGQNAGAGFGQLCRLVSNAHARNGGPAASRSALEALLVEDPQLMVMLGPESDVGLSIAARDAAGARRALERWRAVVPADHLVLEVVCHLAEEGRGSLAPATRMLSLAEASGVPAVLTNAVRYGIPEEAATADLVDAARHLLPLAELGEHLQVNGQAWLKPAVAMEQIARMVVGVKTPHFIRPKDGELMAMAGLYTWWKDPTATGDDDGWHLTTTILTSDAVHTLEHIHVPLPRSFWDVWLDPTVVGALVDEAVRAALPVAEALEWYPVGKVTGHSPALIQPAQ